ncbi:hypothetical protein [Synoicihabitans lomoniglobus]|uniref:Uncharacterized protein n=1 Tax=Synoicihabitans lomoniglobus TaxID=2909285 RepID=A0AAF0CQL6_9BACT|nr:hypothetical protein [Opitutaceae bacterium LMO-M01]WED66247.1 hypothetical protein PXH66_05225 [Opitutaceae bacterium LMO-M01]
MHPACWGARRMMAALVASVLLASWSLAAAPATGPTRLVPLMMTGGVATSVNICLAL